MCFDFFKAFTAFPISLDVLYLCFIYRYATELFKI